MEEEEKKIEEKVKELVAKFKGTRNYHNYTTKTKPTDARAKRFIIDMQADVI